MVAKSRNVFNGATVTGASKGQHPVVSVVVDNTTQDETRSVALAHPEESVLVDVELVKKLAPVWGPKATILLLLAIEYGIDFISKQTEVQLDVSAFALKYSLFSADVLRVITSIKGMNLDAQQLTLPLSFELPLPPATGRK